MTTTRPLTPPPLDRDAARGRRRALRRRRARATSRYAVLDTPVGPLVAAGTDRGLARLAYDDLDGGVDAILDVARARASRRGSSSAPARARPASRRELDEYFAGAPHASTCRSTGRSSRGFGRRVLDATARDPVRRGRDLRRGRRRAPATRAASRAAGNALGANPMPIVVPCHRVLRTGGGLGGYTGGLERKETLLRDRARRADARRLAHSLPGCGNCVRRKRVPHPVGHHRALRHEHVRADGVTR